jgi:hypothetical protein
VLEAIKTALDGGSIGILEENQKATVLACDLA